MYIPKCRCLNYLHQRTTGVWIMSGLEYDVHDNSFVWIFKHSGLNRTMYRLNDVDAWIENTDPELEETFWIPVKRRQSKGKGHFRNHYKRE